MIDGEQRVCLDIIRGDLVSSVITSATRANEFVATWQETNSEEVLSITGVCDHRDANEIELYCRKDSIDTIRILEVKV